MRFLTRIMKTPVEDQDEGQDEFEAEKNGLLMVPSLPGQEGETVEAPQAESDPAAAPAAEEELASALPQDQSTPTEDVEAQPSSSEEDPLDMAEAPAPAESEVQQTAAPAEQAEQDPSNDTLDLFRAAATRDSHLSPALAEDLKDVSAADLLAEARSIRDTLLSAQASGGTRERHREAA
jgi:hypothetical protein